MSNIVDDWNIEVNPTLLDWLDCTAVLLKLNKSEKCNTTTVFYGIRSTIVTKNGFGANDGEEYLRTLQLEYQVSREGWDVSCPEREMVPLRCNVNYDWAHTVGGYIRQSVRDNVTTIRAKEGNVKSVVINVTENTENVIVAI